MYTKEELKKLFRNLEEILDAAPESIADQLDEMLKENEVTDNWWKLYELGDTDQKLINQFGNPDNYKNCDDHEINTWKALVIRLLLNILRRVNITADETKTQQEADRHEILDRIDAAKKEILDELEKRSIIQPVIVSYPETDKDKEDSPLDPYRPCPWTAPSTPYPYYPYTPTVPWPGTVWYQQYTEPYTVTCKVGQAYDSPYGATGC